MMASQGLRIFSLENSFARLRIITNGIVIANFVLRVCITGCRGVPMFIQGCTDSFLLHVQPSMQERARAFKPS